MFTLNKTYIGTIEDIDDPLKIGRAKIRIQFLFDNLPVENLPWAYQKSPLFFGKGGLAGSISVPKKGSIVQVEFENGNLYAPVYTFHQVLADDVKSKLKEEYEGTHILAMDGDSTLKILQTTKTGFTIEFQGSRINIAADSTITIEHKDSDSLIELHGGQIRTTANSLINNTAGSQILNQSNEVWERGVVTKLGTTPIYSAVAGEPLFLLLLAMAEIIDSKLAPTPSLSTSLVKEFKKTVLSTGVKVSLT